MKKFILPLVALMAISAPAMAKTTTLGYVHTNSSCTGTLDVKKSDAWSSAAIFIPANTLRTMAGSQITVVRPGIYSKMKCDALKVWVRYDLDGENLAEGAVESMAKGWLNVDLETPWTIPADIDKGIYIGYSVHHTGVGYPIGNTAIPVEGAFFTNLDGDGWADMAESGSLCLEAVVSGDNLPDTNLSILKLDAPQAFVHSKGSMEGSLVIKNFGTEPASSYDFSMLLDGDKVATQTIQNTIDPGDVITVPFVFQPAIEAPEDFVTYKVRYQLDGVNTGEDADMSDNIDDRMLQVLAMPRERMIVIEEFTTEKCPNCPGGAATINSFVHRDEYKDRAVVICHHSGYYTDQFTTNFDSSYTWFYGSNSTYAPAMMIDRYSMSKSAPVMNVTTDALNRLMPQRLAKEPAIGVDVRAGFSETDSKKVNVVVNCKKFSDELCENPCISLYLVENEIQSASQASGGSKYIHQHVGRAVNSTWGEPVAFDSDYNFEYRYTFTIDRTWNSNNLEVIAVVHNKNMSVPGDWEVQNAGKMAAADFVADPFKASGVTAVGVDNSAEVEYYTLDGIRVNAEGLAPGIYIRKAGNDVTKIAVR